MPPAPSRSTWTTFAWPLALGALIFLALSLTLHLAPANIGNFDQELTRTALSWRHPGITPLVSALTTLGSPLGMTLLTCLTSAYLAIRSSWRPAAFTLCTMLGVALLSAGFKLFFARPRPPLADLLGSPESNYSFPSGHSLGTAAFATILICLAVLAPLSARYKAAAIICSAALALGVGLSRVYLGYHWPTDVLAGWSLGVTWPCLVLLVALFWRQRQTASKPPQLSSAQL
ncbi:phosphatidylglycerophosphatase B [Actinomyces bovis]|uniref:Phosphatidylglycerophosphatase B n=1 Tax=Actinomyces bovis TaxID=1658 RepID=A0ABY1VJZ4_9ACTO|nr:phosphatase PAP2 family protein [Actinomyces bovis]SPT52424.1 phosphatidylglycerophosphatase B [Actinomyces bovis]VEG54058.1 phosphatidylglycerophosphatase B [Actinomyces israelii]